MSGPDIICRGCGARISRAIIDFGSHPIANRLLSNPDETCPVYPLRVILCGHCGLAQVAWPLPPELIFDGAYPYFSSTTQAFVSAAETFVADMLGPTPDRSTLVIEVGSNDGYLLQHVIRRGAKALGIDPCESVAQAARARGAPTITGFFGLEMARAIVAEHGKADLVVANNVIAHVPDPRDFVAGLRELVADRGTVSIEFPWLADLIAGCEFDTVYHDHYSYLSIRAISHLFEQAGLTITRVDHMRVHGGTLRVRAVAAGAAWTHNIKPGLLEWERLALSEKSLSSFYSRGSAKIALLGEALATARRDGMGVAGFGAAAKGVTFLNAAGVVRPDLMFVADDTPAKQGKFLPGSRIPVVSTDDLVAVQPDLVVILPWNWADQCIARLRSAGYRGQYLIPGKSTTMVAAQ